MQLERKIIIACLKGLMASLYITQKLYFDEKMCALICFSNLRQMRNFRFVPESLFVYRNAFQVNIFMLSLACYIFT
jgi:hypothetical protein